MKITWLLLISLCWPVLSSAGEWTFSEPVLVTPETDKRVFHHLESAGRRSIAVSENSVAVAWEDDRDGIPRVYLARKQESETGFSAAVKISGDGEAYEPAVIGLSGSRFLLAWEEGEQVLARIVSVGGAGPVIKLSTSPGGQPSLATYGNGVVAVWSERRGRFGQIQMAELGIKDSLQLEMKRSCSADVAAAKDEQLYPAVTLLAGELVVAWEDRRLGHTVIMAAHGEPCHLSTPVRISAAIDQRSATYGKGHGVSRVAMAAHGADKVLAVWADKRDFREGYDIYAADLQSGKGFGDNMRVQDEFGSVARQWHPTVTGHVDGRLLVAWTDDREGNSDIMMSSYADGEWDEDVPLTGAAGPAEQAHPSIILDDTGRLHITWIERDNRDAPTRLKYMAGNMIVE